LLAPIHHDPASLAERLLYRFGSIGRIVKASDTELRHAAKAGENWVDALLMIRRMIHDGMHEEIVRTRLADNREAMIAYLSMTMRQLPEERLLAIFADKEGFVIAEEIISEGSGAHVIVTPRRVFTRALNLDAHKILLAHNHPSGCAEPSTMDIEHTRLLGLQASGLGLVIEDHLIIGARAVTSMRDRGLL
jgi:DNA repair protein RadC